MSNPIEQVVTEARRAVNDLLAELRQPTEWVTGEHGLNARDSTRLVDNLIRAVEARCAARALGELLTGQTGDPTDEAYNRGVRDAARAARESS